MMTEPTYPYIDHIHGNMECDQARAWMPWAKARIAELETENARLERERREALDYVAPKEKRIQELEKGIEGLKNWVAESKPNVQIYEPGTKVYLSGDDSASDHPLIEATVAVASLQLGRIEYHVYWWTEGKRHQAWITPQEIVRSDDILPVTHMQGVQYK